MKIFLSNQYFYQAGGTETMFFKLLNFLKNEGHEVVTLSVFSEKNIKINGVKSYFTKSYLQQNKLKIPLNRIFNLHAYRVTKKIIEKEKPDIAHFYNTSLMSPSPIIAFLEKNLPVIKTFNDYEHICPDSSKTKWSKFCNKEMSFINCFSCDRRNVNPSIPVIIYYNTLIKKFELNIFKKIHCVSICKIIQNALMQSKIRSELIYQSIDIPKQVPKINFTGNILYAGRLSKEKGVKYLIKSLTIVKKEFPRVKLLIAGDGPERSYLEKLVKKLKLENNIKFLGWLNKENLKNLYENVDFIVLPSIWQEPFGLTGLEAMSYGRPVIAFNVGGISEYVINNKNGFLVDVFDIKSLGEKIKILLNDKKTLLEFSKESIKKSKEFSDDIFFKKIKKLYSKVMLY
ncbi:MAG: glycosyltransferase [Candidatus Aenigmarchaeota archaeon]|nr:glycosyltransferase [Candidatus Aenigmarchaeota archaeon]